MARTAKGVLRSRALVEPPQPPVRGCRPPLRRFCALVSRAEILLRRQGGVFRGSGGSFFWLRGMLLNSSGRFRSSTGVFLRSRGIFLSLSERSPSLRGILRRHSGILRSLHGTFRSFSGILLRSSGVFLSFREVFLSFRGTFRWTSGTFLPPRGVLRGSGDAVPGTGRGVYRRCAAHLPHGKGLLRPAARQRSRKNL